jgi:mRNA degradation ribonuclease J1/J2
MRLVGLEPSARGSRGEVTRVKPVPGFHASGHAGQEELVRLVHDVRPGLLIPIHTEAPRMWAGLLRGVDVRIECPTYAVPIAIR